MRHLALTLCALPCLLLPAGVMAESVQSTPEKIAETGTITLGYREAEPRFSYKTPDGKVIGFSMDLCLRVLEGIERHLEVDKLKVDYMLATPATRFIFVKSGKIDIECVASTNNAERRRNVAFIYSHFVTGSLSATQVADFNSITPYDVGGKHVHPTRRDCKKCCGEICRY